MQIRLSGGGTASPTHCKASVVPICTFILFVLRRLLLISYDFKICSFHICMRIVILPFSPQNYPVTVFSKEVEHTTHSL